jgi:hypothetical protein
MREAVRQRISMEGVTTYLGGPCRIYGEATLADPCAILEIALIPSLKITSMKGFVQPTAETMAHEFPALPALVQLNKERLEGLVTGPGFAAFEEEIELQEAEAEWQDERDHQDRMDIDVDSLRANVGGLDDQLAGVACVRVLHLEHVEHTALRLPACRPHLLSPLLIPSTTQTPNPRPKSPNPNRHMMQRQCVVR